jgi:hypothetical protein
MLIHASLSWFIREIAEVHILPTLGPCPLFELTTAKIRQMWICPRFATFP